MYKRLQSYSGIKLSHDEIREDSKYILGTIMKNIRAIKDTKKEITMPRNKSSITKSVFSRIYNPTVLQLIIARQEEADHEEWQPAAPAAPAVPRRPSVYKYRSLDPS